jgi:urea transport system permease protein
MTIFSKIIAAFGIFILSLTASADDFESVVPGLNSPSYPSKVAAIEKLQSMDDERILPTLKAMADGVLFVNKSNKRLVIGTPAEEGVDLLDIITSEKSSVFSEGALEKIRINNSVRGKLRTAVASLQLFSKDRSLREQSARDLIKKPDASLRDLILKAIDNEQDATLKQEMKVALAMIDVYSDDQKLRKKAVRAFGQSFAPEAVAVLEGLVIKDEQGAYVETNTEIVHLAEITLKRIHSRLKMMGIVENLFFGISLGSVLLLAAIGLAITFGVMGVINMAHGEMIMLGAYTTFAVQQLFPNWIAGSIFIAIPAAFLVSACVGILIERTVIRHLYGRPLETLLATFGISLFLQQLVRTYDTNNVPVITPEWMSGFYQVNGALSFTYNRLYIIIFSLMVLAALALLMRKTMLGLQMRAVTQNRAMANSMGIKSSWVDALTFGLGSGIAGMAGVALSQITNVGPNMGQGFIIDSFMVVVFGGVGNLLGTFFAAISLGVVNKFLEPYSGAVLGKIFVLIFIILFIQWRPRGLFALKGRFVED